MNLHGLDILGFLTAAFAVICIWRAEVSLCIDLTTVEGSPFFHYMLLRGYLDRFLLMASLILGLAMLSLAALRNFVMQLQSSADNVVVTIGEDFRDHVLLFGVVFSTLLAIAYAPAYLRFQEIGNRIRDCLLEPFAPKSGGTAAEIEQWAEHKTKLENAMRLRIRKWESLGPGLSIFAPLAISAITRLLTPVK